MNTELLAVRLNTLRYNGFDIMTKILEFSHSNPKINDSLPTMRIKYNLSLELVGTIYLITLCNEASDITIIDHDNVVLQQPIITEMDYFLFIDNFDYVVQSVAELLLSHDTISDDLYEMMKTDFKEYIINIKNS